MTKWKEYHKGKKVAAYVTDEMHEIILEYAAEKNVFLSDIVRDALEAYINDNIPTK